MKTRFCPSPTGIMTLGNARTALISALAALNQNGQFLIRIEDTDASRSEEVFTDQILSDLKWLGLHWQEGPEVEGPDGPYWQSQRGEIYDRYYAELEKADLAYPCFCSEEQLALNRKMQRIAGQPPRYPGTCRQLSKSDVDAKIAQGHKPTLRFRVPVGTMIEFTDLVRGIQRYPADDMGDFIIRRNDGTSSFMFCNAIDDSLMGVTHALRGEDHLTNSPRQIMILNALKMRMPIYGHISLILGNDGAPLSKRNGSRSIRDLRDEGYLPLAVVNYLGRLGHHYPNDELQPLEQLAQGFRFESLVKSPARFDEVQLLRWQKLVVLTLNKTDLWTWIRSIVEHKVPEHLRDEFVTTVQPNITFPKEAALWADAFFAPHLDQSHEGKEILTAAGIEFFDAALAALTETGTDFKALTEVVKQRCNVKGKALFMPLRVALTGETHGPEMAQVLPLMGIELARQRLEAVLFSL